MSLDSSNGALLYRPGLSMPIPKATVATTTWILSLTKFSWTCFLVLRASPAWYIPQEMFITWNKKLSLILNLILKVKVTFKSPCHRFSFLSCGTINNGWSIKLVVAAISDCQLHHVITHTLSLGINSQEEIWTIKARARHTGIFQFERFADIPTNLRCGCCCQSQKWHMCKLWPQGPKMS